MTSYFDDAREELRTARRLSDYGVMIEAFDRIERQVVTDCTLAAMSSGFPTPLRLRIHHVVLKYGIQTLPRTAPPADFETEDEHRKRLDDLVEGLHSIFHDVGNLGLDGFNDQPPTPMRRLYALGDLEREQLAAGETLPDHPDPMTAVLMEVRRMQGEVFSAQGLVKAAFVKGAEWREKQTDPLKPFAALDAAEDLYPYGLEVKGDG